MEISISASSSRCTVHSRVATKDTTVYGIIQIQTYHLLLVDTINVWVTNSCCTFRTWETAPNWISFSFSFFTKISLMLEILISTRLESTGCFINANSCCCTLQQATRFIWSQNLKNRWWKFHLYLDTSPFHKTTPVSAERLATVSNSRQKYL